MKLIRSLFIAIIVSSCSQPSSIYKSSSTSEESTTIDFGSLTVSVQNSGVFPSPQSMDFASLALKQSGTQDLIISNSSPSLDLLYVASDFDSSLIAPFTITSNSCLVVVKSRKTCKITFSLSNPTSLATAQNLTSLFKVKGVDVSLTGILAADLTDYDVPLVTMSVSPLELNFGAFKIGESKELSIVVKNNASTSSPLVLTAISNPNISIISNTCTNPMTSRKSCAIKIKYTGISVETKATENLLKIANYQVTHSASVISPSVQEPEIMSIEPAQSSASLDLTQPSTQTGSIRFTNTGTISLAAPVSAISSDDGIIISSISCVGGLSRSKSCDVNYTINSQLLPSGVSVQSIKLQSGVNASESYSLNLNITALISQVACTVADAENNGVIVLHSDSSIVGLKTGADTTQCLLASNACTPPYLLSSNSKTCDAPACSLVNSDDYGVNLSFVSSVSGIVPNCVVSDCDQGYAISSDAKSCESSFAFAPFRGFNSSIQTVAVQSDGKKIYGGSFTKFTNSSGVSFDTNRIARINVDGSLDEAFQTSIGQGFNSIVYSIVLDSAQNIYVGGVFSRFNGVSDSAKYLAKLTPSGNLDTAFMSNMDVSPGLKATTSGFNGAINVVSIDSLNNLYVGGSFSSYKGVANSAKNIARLSLAGILDEDFMDKLNVATGIRTTTSGLNGTVSTIAFDSSNNVYLGGSFTTLKGIAFSANRFLKLNYSGTADAAFMDNLNITPNTRAATSAFNNSVNAIKIDSSDNIYLGGSFTTFKGAVNSARYLAKISPSGVLDLPFMDNLDVSPGIRAATSSFNSVVYSIAIDNSNNLYIGGGFNSFKGVASGANRIAKFNSLGEIDAAFMNNLDKTPGIKATTSGANSIILTLALDSSNNIYGGGSFISFKNTSANYNVKLNSSGVLLPYINSSASFNGSILTIVTDSSDNIYFGGDFTHYNGKELGRLARFDSTGNLDQIFTDSVGSGFNGTVNSIVLDNLNNIYVGGNFSSFKGIANNARSIAKLNHLGILNIEFSDNFDTLPGTKVTSSGLNNAVYKLAIDSFGNVFAGGAFTMFKGVANTARYLAKFSSSGVIDLPFMDSMDVMPGTRLTTSGLQGAVSALALDSSNNIYVGGSFNTYKNVPFSAGRLAKINPSGNLDATFMDNLDVSPGVKTISSGLNGPVSALEIDSDNNLYIGGYFNKFKEVNGGANNILKLSLSGVVDTTFMNNLDVISGVKASTSGFASDVYAIAFDTYNNVYVSGGFIDFKGGGEYSANRIVKLSSSGVLDPAFMDNLDVSPGVSAESSGFDSAVNALAVDGSNRIHIGGSFNTFKGTYANFGMTLLDDGSVP